MPPLRLYYQQRLNNYKTCPWPCGQAARARGSSLHGRVLPYVRSSASLVLVFFSAFNFYPWPTDLASFESPRPSLLSSPPCTTHLSCRHPISSLPLLSPQALPLIIRSFAALSCACLPPQMNPSPAAASSPLPLMHHSSAATAPRPARSIGRGGTRASLAVLKNLILNTHTLQLNEQ